MATQMDYPDINCEIPIKVNSFQPKNWITDYQQKYIINGQNCTQERVEQF